MNLTNTPTIETRHRIKKFMLLAALNGTLVGMISVTAPLFAMSLQASTFEIGLVSGVLTLGIALTSIPIGMAIDRMGSRRVFTAGSVAGSIAFFAVSRAEGPGWLILATALASPAIPMHFLSIQSEFFHYLNLAGNSKAGWIRAMQMGGSFAAGPSIAGFLVGALDYRNIYLLVALSFLLLLALGRQVLGGPSEAGARTTHRMRPVLDRLKRVFRHPEMAETSLNAFIASAAFSFYGAFIIVIAIEHFHAGTEAAAALIMAQGISYIGSLLYLGDALERLGKQTYYRLSYALAIAGLILLGSAPGLAQVWIGAILHGLGQGMIAVANVVRQAAVSEQLGRGNVSGAANPPAALGAMSGAVLGGALGDWLGLQHVFYVMITGFMVLLWREFSRETREGIPNVIWESWRLVWSLLPGRWLDLRGLSARLKAQAAGIACVIIGGKE